MSRLRVTKRTNHALLTTTTICRVGDDGEFDELEADDMDADESTPSIDVEVLTLASHCSAYTPLMCWGGCSTEA